MRSHLIKLFASAMFALSLSWSLAPSAFALDDAQKKEFGEFIREYLVENPEVLAEAQAVLEIRQAEAEVLRTQQIISSLSEDLYQTDGDIIVGNPDGDVTIVEFFDYNCGFCKRAMEDMREIIAQDSNVKFILKEFPILGPESTEASRVSLAVTRVAPEKSAEFHIALLGGSGRANAQKAMGIVNDLGIDQAAVEKEMADDSLFDSVRTSYSLAESLGINGTPAYVLANEAIFGAVGVPQILSKIENIRKCGETTCS